MSDKDGGLLGEIFEQGGSIVKQTAKTVVKTPLDLAGGAGSQIIGENGQTQLDLKNTPKQSNPDLAKVQNNPNQKSPEELARIEKLKKELHAEYYQQFTNPRKQEERSAEKVEREEGEKMQELQIKKEEEKKNEPIPVIRAKHKAERFRGASG